MIIFLDIEASSLNPGSFPIEIAWCSADLTRGWSGLIRPCPGWTEWSPASEKIHGLPLAAVTARGLPGADVMRRLNADPAGRECISDNPHHDIKWLFVLARGCGVKPQFGIDTVSLDAVFGKRSWLW